MIILNRTVRPTAWQSGSRFVLKYGTVMRAFGTAMVVLGGFFLYAASRSSQDQRILAWMVSGALAASGLYVFLEVLLVRIEFDDLFIYSFSPWRGTRRIAWSEIITWRYSDVNRWYVIRTEAHGTLLVSTFLSGVGSFLKKLEEARH